MHSRRQIVCLFWFTEQVRSELVCGLAGMSFIILVIININIITVTTGNSLASIEDFDIKIQLS